MTFDSEEKKNEVEGLYSKSDNDKLKFHRLAPELEIKICDTLEDAELFVSQLLSNQMFYATTDAFYNFIYQSPDCVGICNECRPLQDAEKLLIEITKQLRDS